MRDLRVSRQIHSPYKLRYDKIRLEKLRDVVSWEVERAKEKLGYLRQQLIVIDLPWIRKRRGIHDDPR